MARWLIALALVSACKVRDPAPVTAPWQDVFERDSIGLDYLAAGSGYAVAGGRLIAAAAHAHPLWLRKRLPHDVRIELDCGASDPAGEVRVELFGDGGGEPAGAPPIPTGYTFAISGGEARLDRPAALGVHAPAPPRGPDGRMHWKIERTGRTVRWFVRDMQHPLLTYVDPHPLEDDAHAYFGVVDGTDATWFDNLAITPL